MSFAQALRDRLLARAARLSARMEEESRPAAPAMPAAASGTPAENEAHAAALAALERHDAAAADAALAPVIADARRAETLTLHARLQLLRGEVGAAKASLERAVGLEPGNAAALEALAALLAGEGDAAGEYRIRRQRLLATPDVGPREAIDAIAALARAAAQGMEAAASELQLVSRQFERVAARATAQERVEYAEWLFLFKPGRLRARNLVEQNTPQDAALGTRLLSLVPPSALAAEDMVASHEKADDLLEGVPLRALELACAGVLPDLQWTPWLPHTGQALRGYASRQAPTARQQPGSALLMQNKWQVLARLPIGEPHRIDGTSVLVGSAQNVHHFLLDHLSRLATLGFLGVPVDDARVVVGTEAQPFEGELLALMGIGADRLVRVRPHENAVFERLVAPVPLGRGPRKASPLLARWARQVLVPAAGAFDRKARRRIYLSSQSGRVRVANDDEVVGALAERGFEHVRAEEHGAADLVRLFGQASEVVTALGPALAYMLFMPPGGRVAALFDSHVPAGPEQLEFDYLAQACGHTLLAVPGVPAAARTTASQADVVVTNADLHAAVGT